MIKSLLIAGQRVSLAGATLIGSGGEADVYALADGRALKIFKMPNHPDFAGQPDLQRLAAERLAIHQTKLRAFPLPFPPAVLQPAALALHPTTQRVMGYVMPLLAGAEPLFRYSDPGFRARGVAPASVTAIFRRLHALVMAVHQAGAVIGDFTDYNVLIAAENPYLVDVDSFQFGAYPCTQFTVRFVDPLECDPGAPSPQRLYPPTPDADWFAFATMLFECLLLVHPYGGVYRPGTTNARVSHDTRPLRGISVFHADVRYPKRALPLRTLPDALLDHLQAIFERQQRGVFPLDLLADLHWTTCAQCGLAHTRPACPVCAPLYRMPAVTLRPALGAGAIIFTTAGVLLAATVQGNALLWLVAEQGRLIREDGTVIGTGTADPHMRIRLAGATTIFSKQGRLVALTPDQPARHIIVDSFRGAAGREAIPVCDANARGVYWAAGGHIYRDGVLRDTYESIGAGIAGQTHFWMGPTFGFGFYRVGAKMVAFVFDAERGGLNDMIAMPPLPGVLLDVSCVFGVACCWFFVALQAGTRTQHHCMQITRNGAVGGMATAPRGDDSWLGSLRGGCANGTSLLMPTNAGIVQIATAQGQMYETQRFPDAAAVIGPETRLLPAAGGCYLVDRRTIRRMSLS